MSRRGGACHAAKRLRLQQAEHTDKSASMELPAYSNKLLLLISVVESFHCMLAWLQQCNAQGAALFSFVLIPPRAIGLFTRARVHGMLLTHAERLRVTGCGLNGNLVQLLSLGTGGHFEQQPRNWGARRKMLQSIVRRVSARLAAEVRGKVAIEARELCASGQCAAAVVSLKLAVDLGDLPSRALNAWMLIEGREGVAMDRNRAFELVEEGARMGCHHCQGVMSLCCAWGCGCEVDAARSLELARESSVQRVRTFHTRLAAPLGSRRTCRRHRRCGCVLPGGCSARPGCRPVRPPSSRTVFL